MIKAITFDLDGVYFINGKEVFLENLVRNGVDKEKALLVFHGDRMNKEYKLGKITDDEYWSWAIGQWKLKMSVKEVIDLLIGGYELNIRVAEVVHNVRRSGYRTLICSNNFPARVNGLEERFHFLQNFDAAVFSYEIGVAKPEEGIFNEMVRRSGVHPREILYADDRDQNVWGAKQIGIEAFFYEGFEKFVERLTSLGIPT